jgi:uncharacterized lipoprotein YbaY
MAQTAVPMECRLVSRPLATRRLLLTAMAALCALPALADGEEPVLKIRGEMTYLQRIALPENALAIVEVKPDDAPDGASVTAETRIPLRGGQVPVAFALDVPRAHLDASTTYVLRGAILVDSQPRWLSDPVAIDVQAATVDVGTLRLSPYEAPAPTPAPAPVVEDHDRFRRGWRLFRPAVQRLSRTLQARRRLDFLRQCGRDADGLPRAAGDAGAGAVCRLAAGDQLAHR